MRWVALNAAQDRIQLKQAAMGRFEIPNWGDAGGATTEERFGAREQVDPVRHLLFTAAGWGGNPREAAAVL